MGSLNGRMRRLEERYDRDDDAEERARRTEEKRAEIRARLQRVIAQEEQIEAERLEALDVIRRGIERRRGRGA